MIPLAPRRRRPLRSMFLLGLLAATSTSARADGPSADSAIDYARDIRPILSDKCFACHGPDDAKREAKLRLDRQADATATRGDHAAAIVPGDPDESELVFRIESDDDTLRMPPPDSGKSLTPRQVEMLRAWVAQGAKYADHWAFVPVATPPVPAVSDPTWVRNPIDAFVLARLDREGLKPSPEADRTTLIRRLSLDLLGLPPSVQEVDAFVNDTAPDAYDKLVERLLSSPHYGERWGRLWLDAARYADSDGYEKDKKREVWFYRDWVVRAFNDDLPYDRFLTDQIAGDLFPSPTQDQLVATGFLRNSMINEEGGIDPEQFRMEAMFDRMDAIGTSVLGLTLKCAQCHTHKYDPISHEDYYRIFAYLNDSDEAAVAVYTPEEQARRADVLRRVNEVEDQLKHATPDWAERMSTWESTLCRDDKTAWTLITPTAEDNSTGGQKYLKQADGSILAQGYAPTKHRVRLEIDVPPTRITAFRLELLNDPNLPLGGPGRSIYGTGALTEFEVEAASVDAPDKVTKVKFKKATADVNPPETPLDPIYDDKSGKTRVTGPIDFALDGNNETAWGFDLGPGRTNQPRKAVFVAETPIENPSGSRLTIFLTQNHGGWNSDDNQNCNLGRFRLAVTDADDPVADPLPAAARAALAVPAAKRTPGQVSSIFSYWRTTVPEWKDANDQIETLWKDHPRGTSQLVLARRMDARPTSILERGDFLKPVKPVEPGLPTFLNPPPDGAAPDRLTLAHWLVDRQAPTTARAFVNRVWQSYLGTGLVETAEDLGSQGAPPSHPDLLDWLAATFMDRGWSVKELHRLIATSNTYRQGSAVAPELAARDPYNRLLARGPRVRVDAEIVRDIALAASGLLDPAVGGPPAYPPAPEFLFLPPTSYGPKVWQESKGPERYRRALYTFRFRSVPYPALQAFDAPNGDIACVRRTRSNTPLQALTTLNEPIFLDAARALALRTLKEGGPDDRARLIYAFRHCLSRQPSDAEIDTLLALRDRQAIHFAEPGNDPWTLAAADPKSPPTLPEGDTPADAASWTAVCRVLLNLDETITKE